MANDVTVPTIIPCSNAAGSFSVTVVTFNKRQTPKQNSLNFHALLLTEDTLIGAYIRNSGQNAV